MTVSRVLLSSGNLLMDSANVYQKSALSPSSNELLTSLRLQLRSSSPTAYSESSASSSASASSSTSSDSFCIPTAPDNLAKPLAEPRSSYDITVKLFLPSLDPSHVERAINHVLSMLDVLTIDLLILSLPGITFDADDVLTTIATAEPPSWLPVYHALESLYDVGILKAIGVSEFNMLRLSELLGYVDVKPSVNQINVRNCCIVPQNLIIYAKEVGIELLTHNDDTDILPAQVLKGMLVDEFGVLEEEYAQEVRPQWIAKYTAVVKSRGVVENKGYIAMAEIRY